MFRAPQVNCLSLFLSPFLVVLGSCGDRHGDVAAATSVLRPKRHLFCVRRCHYHCIVADVGGCGYDIVLVCRVMLVVYVGGGRLLNAGVVYI